MLVGCVCAFDNIFSIFSCIHYKKLLITSEKKLMVPCGNVMSPVLFPYTSAIAFWCTEEAF